MTAGETEAMSAAVLGGTLRYCAPLLLASSGELVSERSGVVNIGIEGMMLAGAFGGALSAGLLVGWGYGGVEWGWLAWICWMVAGAFGAGMGLLFAGLVVGLGRDQIVAGLALNLLAIGGTSSLHFVIEQRRSGGVSDLSLGGLGFGPMVAGSDAGSVLGSLGLQPGALVWAMLSLPLCWLWLERTRPGLRLRAAGDHPGAVDTAGLRVGRIRTGACVFGGWMAGLAGGYLSLALTRSFSDNMTAGTGFVALALVIFGRWQAGWIMLAGLFFGFLSAMRPALQGSESLREALRPVLGEIRIDTTYPLVEAVPYVLTLLTLAGLAGRSRAPAGLGRPYHR